jgi:hypothetical protein
MKNSGKWIKMKVGTFDTNVFKRIKHAEIGGVSIRDTLTSVWFELLALAGRGDRDGLLVDKSGVPYKSINEIAIEIDRSESQLNMCMEFYLEQWMVKSIDGTYKVSDWFLYNN